ncbi:MAG: AEC family transporter [Planctomycetota bacterium]
MFLRFFVRVAAIFCMIGFGVLARRLKLIDRSAISQLSKLVTTFFYPALVFSSLVQNYTLDSLLGNWPLPLGAFSIMLGGYLIGSVAVRLIPFNTERRKNQFLFQSTINNYSFLPMSIIMMLWGQEGVAQLILATFGAEILLWTLGIFILTGNKFSRESLKNLLSVPIMAILTAICVIVARSFGGESLSETFSTSAFAHVSTSFLDMLQMFGSATVPLAMFLAGSRVAELHPDHFVDLQQVLIVALRLLIIPAAAVGFLFLLPFAPDLRRILLIMAVMPCAITSVILADVYDSDTDFAASSVLTTQIVSILTIPAWLTLLNP